MTHADMEQAVASATGESLGTVRRRGFSIIDFSEANFDPEPNDLPAQVVDWDRLHDGLWRRLK